MELTLILQYEYVNLRFNKDGKISVGSYLNPILLKIKCDCCYEIYEQKVKDYQDRLNLISKEFCTKCAKPLIYGACALKGVYDIHGNLKHNSGRYTSEKVKIMSKEEYEIYCKQRKNASNVLQEKLKDPEYYKNHFEKVFQNSKIGYISKGQKEIFSFLEKYGFELEKTVLGVRCDIINIEKKICIEYYGDYFHASPKIYKPEDYIKAIKLTAQEKWEKDRIRNLKLSKEGFKVIIIWENEWINTPVQGLKRIKNILPELEFTSEDIEKNCKQLTSKKMRNDKICKNKYVKLAEVDNHLQNGWKFGFCSKYNSKYEKKKENNEIYKNRRNYY